MLALLFLITTILTPHGVGVLELNTTGVVNVTGPFQFEVVEGNNTTLVKVYPIPGMVYRQEEGIVITIQEGESTIKYPAIVRIAYSDIPGKVEVGNISVVNESFVVEQERQENVWVKWAEVALGILIGLLILYLIAKKLAG